MAKQSGVAERSDADDRLRSMRQRSIWKQSSTKQDNPMRQNKRSQRQLSFFITWTTNYLTNRILQVETLKRDHNRTKPSRPEISSEGLCTMEIYSSLARKYWNMFDMNELSLSCQSENLSSLRRIVTHTTATISGSIQNIELEKKQASTIANIHFNLSARSSQWQQRVRFTSNFSVLRQYIISLYLLRMQQAYGAINDTE